LFVIGEEIGGVPDEGYRNFVREVTAALARRRPVHVYTAGAETAEGVRRLGRRNRLLAHPILWGDLQRHRPETIIYVYPASPAALLRARILKLVSRGAQVVIIALQPHGLSRWSRPLARLLWPDLLLVGSESELRQTLRMGANAARARFGVDLDRFRPPRRGEKPALRRKWGMPEDTQIVLHVGHLQDDRNLRALVPLASKPGTTVAVLVSGHKTKESERLKAELEQQGVVILEGYRPQVEELYQLADCYVFPVIQSRGAIAMPLSVLEALASDLPVASTRFGVLPEIFADTAGVRFADTGEELAAAVDELLQLRPSTRHLAEPYSWDATADQLLKQLDEARSPAGGSRPGLQHRLSIGLAVLRRRRSDYEERLRSLFWGQRMGFELRPSPREPATLVEVRAPTPESTAAASPRVGCVGVLTAETSAHDSPSLEHAARFYGLTVTSAAVSGGSALLAQAVRERWPLLGVSLRGLMAVPSEWPGLFREFLGVGGTLFLHDLDLRSTDLLAVIGRALDVSLPACRELPGAVHPVLFSGSSPGLTQEFAGVRIEGCECRTFLSATGGAKVPASVVAKDRPLPAVVELQVAGGRLVLCAGKQRIQSTLADAFGPTHAPAVLPSMMLIRQLYGRAAWHTPAALANFIIDDPVLRNGLLGLDYGHALAQALAHDFHLTVATIPRDLNLAEPAVIQTLQDHPLHLSACYHGNEHDGYEFYFPEARRLRWRQRPLAGQQRALREAVQRGERLARETGYALDRVMVFPHGLGPVQILPSLADLGFVATCNAFDRYPLGGDPPEDPEVGMRPADFAWGGFPLVWRRPLADRTFIFDLFVGRPAITFAHRRELGRDLVPFAERARAINQLAGGRARWRGLEEIARHCYLQRRDPHEGWQVRMLANEICLHNPDSQTRAYRVQRPRRPAGTGLVAEGTAYGADELLVTVAAGGTTQVRLTRSPDGRLEGARPCSIV